MYCIILTKIRQYFEINLHQFIWIQFIRYCSTAKVFQEEDSLCD